MDRADRRRPRRLRRRALAPAEPRRAGRVPAGPRRRAEGPVRRPRRHLAPPVRRPARRGQVLRPGRRAHLRVLRRPGRHVPVRGAGHADRRRHVRRARPRAGGRRRGDHPVERPPRPHRQQGRPGPPRRLHRRAQGVARGAGRGLRRGRGRRGDRAPARCPQRPHRRPRGLRAARPRSPRRQDHLHRLHRRRPPDRLAVRRAHRPLHARARRQVGGRDPRRHGPRHRRRRPSPGPSASSPARSARR